MCYVLYCWLVNICSMHGYITTMSLEQMSPSLWVTRKDICKRCNNTIPSSIIDMIRTLWQYKAWQCSMIELHVLNRIGIVVSDKIMSVIDVKDETKYNDTNWKQGTEVKCIPIGRNKCLKPFVILAHWHLLLASKCVSLANYWMTLLFFSVFLYPHHELVSQQICESYIVR